MNITISPAAREAAEKERQQERKDLFPDLVRNSDEKRIGHHVQILINSLEKEIEKLKSEVGLGWSSEVEKERQSHMSKRTSPVLAKAKQKGSLTQ